MTQLLILKINVMNVAGRRRRRRMAERAQLQWKGYAIYYFFISVFIYLYFCICVHTIVQLTPQGGDDRQQKLRERVLKQF